MNGDSFFEKVTTRVDRERVYNILVERKISVTVVDEKKKTIVCEPRFLTGHKMVMSAGDDRLLPEPGISVITFSIGNEKYFLKTKLEEGRGADIHLDMQSDLYKLQRRNSFRLNIPSGYAARIEIFSRDLKKTKEKHDLVDLSGGGFAFELPAGNEPQFKKGELLSVILQVGPDFRSQIDAVVRHSRMVGSRGSGLCRVGCEFIKIQPAIQNEIVNLVMNIHRDMFSKFKLI